MGKWVGERVGKWVGERWVGKRVGKWVSERVGEWVSRWFSEHGLAVSYVLEQMVPKLV